jgi:hypothetical protein
LLTTAGFVAQPAAPAGAKPAYLARAVARYPHLADSRLDGCGLCHRDGLGDGERNAFALDFEDHGYDFAAIETFDSDEDGFTNLEEFEARTFPGNPKSQPIPKAASKPVSEPAPILCRLDGQREDLSVAAGGPVQLSSPGDESNALLRSLVLVWTRPQPAPPLAGDAGRGRDLFEARTLGPNHTPGCGTCHLPELATPLGPSRFGLARRSAATVRLPIYGGQATTGQAYLFESLVNPNLYIVPAFTPGLMPDSYAQDLTSPEIADLIAYMLTLR